MTEIFNDIPENIKILIKTWADVAFNKPNPLESAEMLTFFENAKTLSDRIKEYAEFYFKLRMEQLKNESNTNISEESTR